MKKLMMFAAMFAAIAASAAVTITDVSARQRWPWNNLVDVDFAIAGNAGEVYAIDITATVAGGEKTLCATTFATEPIATAGATNRVVWDLGADYPNFKATDVRVTVTATPFSDSTPIYLVVDLSGGSSAEKWPVRYTTTPPAHVQGATSEVCQTTELWLRRIPAGTDVLGVGDLSTSGYQHWPRHTVKLTQSFYCAIFETTEKQYERMTGGYYGNSTNPDDIFRDARPVAKINNHVIWGNSTTHSLAHGGVIGELRNKTGLSGWELPTEAQWEYAARAGNDDERYGDVNEISRNSGNASSGQEGGDAAVVGSYLPNAWGLYDTLGNVAEFCRDRAVTDYITKDYIYTNPWNYTSSGTTYFPARGGTYSNSETFIKFPQRDRKQNGVSYSSACGFRLVMVVGGLTTDNISSEAPAE